MFFGAEPHWGTFNQWKGMSKHSTACNKSATGEGTRKEKRPDCGADCHIVSVRKGEKATTYALRPLMRKEMLESGEERTRVFGFTPFPVFHSGQVDGYSIPIENPDAPRVDASTIEDVFAFADAAGAVVERSAFAGASYSPSLDRITMPDADRWKDVGGAWGTMVHELVHWTGHESRLSRDLSGRFGDDAYAAEELVAELGAAFALSSMGMFATPRADHARYLAHWLRVLKADPKHLVTVASLAEKAAALIIEKTESGADNSVEAPAGELVAA
jgi:antirestriction protein ArdC